MRPSPIPSILMPLPDYDFDVTEASIPWKACTSRGWRVAISTEHGNVAQGDPFKLKGPLPGQLGELLGLGTKAHAAYREMIKDPDYQHPIPYAEIDPDQHLALLLPGGDTPRMRQYLECPVLQNKVLQFSQQSKLIGAICHGILVLARTINPQTGCSVLYGHKVTALPQSLDRFGYLLTRILRREYLTYSCSVEAEVRACLERPEDFSSWQSILSPYVVSDGNLITSRWYMDAHVFAERFAQMLEQRVRADKATS